MCQIPLNKGSLQLVKQDDRSIDMMIVSDNLAASVKLWSKEANALLTALVKLGAAEA